MATPWHVAQAGEFEPEEEALPEGTEGVRGYEPEPQRRWHAWYLACALAGVAVLCMVPGVREIVRHYTAEESSGIGNWAYVVLCVGVLQLGYALLLAQAPDWSTTMVVAVLSLVVMAAYAAVLSVSLTGNRDSEMVTWLQLGDLLAGREAARWCLVMLGVTSLVCYFLGRFGMAWIQQYTTLAALQAGK